MKRNNKEYLGVTYGRKYKLSGFLIGFSIGFLGGMVLFANYKASLVFALMFGIFFIKKWIDFWLEKRKQNFLYQFCDFLDSISTSLSCGKNSYYAFLNADRDMKALYGPNEPVCIVCSRLTEGMENGEPVSVLLFQMAEDSMCHEVRTFAMIYSIGVSVGGNLKHIVDYQKDAVVSI